MDVGPTFFKEVGRFDFLEESVRLVPGVAMLVGQRRIDRRLFLPKPGPMSILQNPVFI
jgi:hypothetical protein